MKKLMIFAVLAATSFTTFAQVGIGTTTPHPSAALDVTSTTSGFLPPRMTQAQRNAITSPAAGLTVYDTTTNSNWFFNGTIWVNAAAPAAGTTHFVGDSYGGGIVFWVTTDGLHGLIAETIDQGNSTWFNAQNIISINSTHSTAGRLYTDWRLPTRNELILLFSQRTTVGGFASAYYWSSSESGSSTAWAQDFDNGSQYGSNKNATHYVWAVRAF
jgi:hypothetical protein